MQFKLLADMEQKWDTNKTIVKNIRNKNRGFYENIGGKAIKAETKGRVTIPTDLDIDSGTLKAGRVEFAVQMRDSFDGQV